MEPRLSFVTLGVRDLGTSIRFYADGLRLRQLKSLPTVSFFDLGGVRLALTYDSFEEARRRMLGLGTLVEVLEPAELRASVAAYAREIATFYANALAPAGD